MVETLAEPGCRERGQTVVCPAHAGRREAVIQLPETLRPAIGSVAQAAIFGKDGTSVPAQLRQLSDAADRLTRTFEARYVLSGELANAPLGATVTIQGCRCTHHRPRQSAGAVGCAVRCRQGFGRVGDPGDPAKVTWRSVTIVRLGDEGARWQASQAGDRIVALTRSCCVRASKSAPAGRDAGTAIAGCVREPRPLQPLQPLRARGARARRHIIPICLISGGSFPSSLGARRTRRSRSR